MKNSNLSSARDNTQQELPHINTSFQFSDSDMINNVHLKTQPNHHDQAKRGTQRRILFSPTTDKRMSTEYVHVHDTRDTN